MDKKIHYRFQRKENNVGKRPQKQNAPEKESLSLHLAPRFCLEPVNEGLHQ